MTLNKKFPYIVKVNKIQCIICTRKHMYLQVCLSIEGTMNLFWPWLSLFLGWDSLAIASLGEYIIYHIHIYIHIYLTLPIPHN